MINIDTPFTPENRISSDIEILKHDIERLHVLSEKFEETINKFTDLANNINTILAVHETRIDNNDKTFSLITAYIKSLEEKIVQLEAKIESVVRWKYMMMGVALVIGFILSKTSFLDNILKAFNI